MTAIRESASQDNYTLIARVVGVRIGCRAYPGHLRDGNPRTDRGVNIMHAKKRNIAFPLRERLVLRSKSRMRCFKSEAFGVSSPHLSTPLTPSPISRGRLFNVIIRKADYYSLSFNVDVASCEI